MADYYGINATLAKNPIGANITDPGLLGGNIRVMLDEYEFAGEAATKTVAVGKALPVGARVVGICAAWDDLTDGGGTMDIGDLDDDDRYASALAVGTAAAMTEIPLLIAGANYEVLGEGAAQGYDDTQILCLINTAALTGTFKIAIFYTVG